MTGGGDATDSMLLGPHAERVMMSFISRAYIPLHDRTFSSYYYNIVCVLKVFGGRHIRVYSYTVGVKGRWSRAPPTIPLTTFGSPPLCSIA